MDSHNMLVGGNKETRLRDLQLKSLEILVYFKEFCQQHDLHFLLYGGSCIGAIRHKGFIPWDDDIDVVMFREDFERLGRLWEKYADTEKYVYCRSNEKINYKHPMASIRDIRTTYVTDYQKDLDIVHSVRLDIIALDGYPDSKIKRIIQLGWAFVYHLFNREATSSNHFRFIGKMASLILRIIRKPETRYKIWKYAERQMSKYEIKEDTKYLTDLQSVFRFMRLQYPKKYFHEAIYMEFEGHMMPVPKGYDGYLKMAFGDYMEYPPQKERVPKHDASYINLEEGYKKFKGIHYCLGDK